MGENITVTRNSICAAKGESPKVCGVCICVWVIRALGVGGQYLSSIYRHGNSQCECSCTSKYSSHKEGRTSVLANCNTKTDKLKERVKYKAESNFFLLGSKDSSEDSAESSLYAVIAFWWKASDKVSHFKDLSFSL